MANDIRAQYNEQDYSAQDLARFDGADALSAGNFQYRREGTEIGGADALVHALIREHAVLPGLKVTLMDGRVLGEFASELLLPPGLTLFVGFKGNGTTELGSLSLPHQTLPGVLCVYTLEAVRAKQSANVGPYQTLSIHFERAQFLELLREHCLDDAEMHRILGALAGTEQGGFWHPGAEILEELNSLIYTELTGIDLSLFVHQTVLGLLRALMNHLRQPADPSASTRRQDLKSGDVKNIQRVASYIEANLSAKLTVDAISRAVGVSGQYLKHYFPRLYGDSVSYYVLKTRMNHARVKLASGSMSIQQVAAHVGYGSQASFTTAFRKYHSMTPREASRACLQPRSGRTAHAEDNARRAPPKTA